MLQRGLFWLDVDYSSRTGGVAGVVRQYGVVHTGSIVEATRTITGNPQPWAAVVTNLSGRERHLAYLRDVAPSLPVLVLVDDPTESAVVSLRARAFNYATLEQAEAVIPVFAERALTASFFPHAAVVDVVRELVASARLNPREVQILVCSLADEPRSEIQKRLGVSDNTFRTNVKGLVHKCGARNLESLTVSTLRAAVLKNGRESKAPYALTLVR